MIQSGWCIVSRWPICSTVVVLLSSSIKKTQCVGLSAYHHCHCVVIEHCGDILGGELVGGVRDEETSFSHCPVPNNYTLYCLHVEPLTLYHILGFILEYFSCRSELSKLFA